MSHVLDLLVGPQNQSLTSPIDNGNAEFNLANYLNIDEAVTNLGDLLNTISSLMEVDAGGWDSLPFDFDVSSSQNVYRLPVGGEFMNNDFVGCVSADTWDDAHNLPGWPERWCQHKRPDLEAYLGGQVYLEGATHLGFPVHSPKTPICECVEKMETFEIDGVRTIEGEPVRGVRLEPWSFMPVSITSNDYQKDWLVRYKIHTEGSMDSIKAFVMLPDGSTTGYLTFTEASTPTPLKAR